MIRCFIACKQGLKRENQIERADNKLSTTLIKQVDPEIARVIENEFKRQQETLELIASENIASQAVMAVQGSVMTNKYAEGYPDSRYYGGCEFMDMAETLAIERARQLFGAEFANVQPHSGSQANMAAYFALLKPGDTILGMNLAHGGHLTHGSPVSFSGKLFRFVHYGVDLDSGRIDYAQVARLAEQHAPRMIIAGASAYPRIIDFEAFARIAASVQAYFLVDMAHIAGLVAAGVHPSPVPLADVVTSTTHKTLKGPRGGLILAKADYANRINKEIFPGIQGGPLMHVIAAKAVALQEAFTKEFKDYQGNVVRNAKTLAQHLIEAGIQLVSGGTDNHMLLLDLTKINITGKDAQEVLGQAGFTVNKNAIPNDPLSLQITSGIRIGTPAVTARGMTAVEMKKIADLMVAVLHNPKSESVINNARAEVKALCEAFPIYSPAETQR